jgi:hypothetical protein
MQDRYVADVGDFGKFQLFRYLFNHEQSPLNGKELSQIWFMHKGEGEENNDGRHIDYFERMVGTDEYLEHSLLDVISVYFIILSCSKEFLWIKNIL